MTEEPRLHLSPTFSLPLDAVTDTFGLLAKRGAGKTNAAVAMAEEMFANGLPFVVIDPVGSWWGVRAAGEGGPGLPVLVFGGEHGDLPLEPTAGRMVADLVVDQNLSCVLDISLMDEEDELPQFVTDLLRQLFLRNRDPRHLFIEEAEAILPQTVTRDLAPMFKAGNRIIKLGRGRGLGVTLITQRSAALNKNALTQMEVLIALRTTAPTDQAAIRAWMKHHETGAEAVSRLGGLAWARRGCGARSPGWSSRSTSSAMSWARLTCSNSGYASRRPPSVTAIAPYATRSGRRTPCSAAC